MRIRYNRKNMQREQEGSINNIVFPKPLCVWASFSTPLSKTKTHTGQGSNPHKTAPPTPTLHPSWFAQTAAVGSIWEHDVCGRGASFECLHDAPSPRPKHVWVTRRVLSVIFVQVCFSQTTLCLGGPVQKTCRARCGSVTTEKTCKGNKRDQ